MDVEKKSLKNEVWVKKTLKSLDKKLSPIKSNLLPPRDTISSDRSHPLPTKVTLRMHKPLNKLDDFFPFFTKSTEWKFATFFEKIAIPLPATFEIVQNLNIPQNVFFYN